MLRLLSVLAVVLATPALSFAQVLQDEVPLRTDSLAEAKDMWDRSEAMFIAATKAQAVGAVVDAGAFVQAAVSSLESDGYQVRKRPPSKAPFSDFLCFTDKPIRGSSVCFTLDEPPKREDICLWAPLGVYLTNEIFSSTMPAYLFAPAPTRITE